MISTIGMQMMKKIIIKIGPFWPYMVDYGVISLLFIRYLNICIIQFMFGIKAMDGQWLR
jgi:hypothetical protein